MQSSSPVVVIGNFDGVHSGHRAVIDDARQHGEVVAVTFTPHPLEVIRPDAAPRLLTSPAEKRALLLAAGVTEVVEIGFNREVSEWSPAEFVERILLPLHPSRVVVGQNFRFGHRAAGDHHTLASLGAGKFVVEALPLFANASSTAIREAVATGDVAAAARMLGRPFRYCHAVVRGFQRGRELGFPTANLPVDHRRVAPADGIYAGWMTRLDHHGTELVESERWPAAVSVGTNPTFDDVEATVVEAYALDRSDLELYGVTVAVDFVARLRGNVKFEGLQPLMAQIAQDCLDTKKILGITPE